MSEAARVPAEPMVKPLDLALAGNPNTGKTSLFNRLTGARARVGNYPGITVEKRVGSFAGAGRSWRVHDLPGCYSIDADAPDEEVARGALQGGFGAPSFDVVVVLLDASQLARNLLLLLQVAEMNAPVVAALNLVQDAREAGIEVEVEGLSADLGCPVVPIEAPLGVGLEELIAAVEGTARGKSRQRIDTGVRGDEATSNERIRAHFARIDELVGRHVRTGARHTTWTERIDRLALHPLLGPGLFVLAVGVLFQAVFAWSEPAMEAIGGAGSVLTARLTELLPGGLFRGVLVDGVVAGAVGTAVFLPQICILFVGIEVLEDSGYLARSAYVIDHLMRAVGLPGRCFVPLLSAFACNVPGIMATRTIPSRSDRLVTILIAPLMTCSARLPVYTMVTAAVFAGATPVLGFFSIGGLVITALYLLGIGVALLAALVLRRTVLRGRGRPLLLELPPYRWPRPRNVARRVRDRAWLFIRGTGPVIVALTVVLWGLMSFPRVTPDSAEYTGLVATAAAAGEIEAGRIAARRAEHLRDQFQLEHSLAGRIGKLIEPAIAPMGMDWRIGIGLVGSFAAREVLIPVMGRVYGRGGAADEASSGGSFSEGVGRSLVGISGMTPLVGVSLMVFFAIAMQCLSTVAVIRHETRSWRWPAFAILYLNALAWLLATTVFQVGSALGYA